MKFCVFTAILVSTICTIFNVKAYSGEIPWPDYLIPLPHEIAVSSTVRIAPDQISFSTPANASSMVTQAVAELRAAWQVKSSCVPAGTAFVITIGRLSDDGRLNGKAVDGADRINQVQSPDQAYLIRPLGSNGLVVAAWNDKGVFYGIQTLTQLLTAKLTKTEAIIPMAIITDWPDMDERGLWNVGWSTPGFIPWLAAIKLNFTHIPTELILKKGEPAQCPPLPTDIIRQANQRAFHLVPHIPHYDYWYRSGISNLYPELVGQGTSAINPVAWRQQDKEIYFNSTRCPCASNPKFKEIVADWIRSAADQGAREISLWLTEFTPCQCECENCIKNGRKQFQLETRASVDALQTVEKQYPDLVGRICFTLSYGPKDTEDSAECLAMLPKSGIKAEKHYGRNKAFDEYAARGNWVASYSGPALVSGGIARFNTAAPMLSCLREYHANHYSALYCIGYCYAPQNLKGDFERTFGGYQLNALAEWAWNINGRDVKTFARAYAVRAGMKNPEKFAEWIMLMVPVENTMSSFHYFAVPTWEKSLAAMSERKPLPDRFPKPDVLSNLLATCDGAIPVAEATGDPSVLEETLLARSYLQSLRHLADLHGRIMASSAENNVDQAAVAQTKKAIKDSLEASISHLEKMVMSFGLDPKAGPELVVSNYKKIVQSIIERIDALELIRKLT